MKNDEECKCVVCLLAVDNKKINKVNKKVKFINYGGFKAVKLEINVIFCIWSNKSINQRLGVDSQRLEQTFSLFSLNVPKNQ